MERYYPDDKIIAHSPFSGTDFNADFRGYIDAEKCCVWTGKSQLIIPVSWIIGLQIGGK